MASYSTNGETDIHLKSVRLFTCVFVLIFISSAWKNKPKTSFSYPLRGKDNRIEVLVGDAFENKGALIVPVNDQFDMSLGGNVTKANSIQNQVIQKYYAGKVDHLNTDISKSIKIGKKYEIGKTIEVEQNGKKFYLVVNSIKRSNNRVRSEIDDFIQTLNGLWQYVAIDSGRNTILTIPLINTQHGRDSYLSRKGAIKEIISSYVEASKYLNICEKLVISIHPSDLEKGEIDLDDIDDYLKFSCKHFRQLTLQQRSEDPDKGSKVIKIEN
ncbi:MAG: DUF6430 domain-containing protein [Candidatus Nomurabacteria bacterium]|nr:DUF6430 domain-containing protein [Candidatus Nomurabacteria bacterium]